MKCRNCEHHLTHEFIDLFTSPPSNSFLKESDLTKSESYYPLKVMLCDSCYLVQIDEYKASEEIFNSEYIYFSSFSKSWLAHAANYVDLMVERFKLNHKS